MPRHLVLPLLAVALVGGAIWIVTRGRAAYLEHSFPNVVYELPQEFEVGFPEEFAVGQVDERFKASGVWIVREEEGFYVLSTICTRLGCTVDWLTSEQKFVCPCFGSSFLKTGINIAGPAPRPLERFKIVMAEDGQLRIDKNTKYQQEKGQWGMDGAFLIYP